MIGADQIRASLVGGALGDAWGGPYEGRPGPLAAPFPDVGQLSDDTYLTIATCEAIAEARGTVAAGAIAHSFKCWFNAGRLPGLGSSTLKAMRDLAAGAHWATAGARGEYAAGAGAAMRIAPLAFVLDPTIDDHRVRIRDVVRITHHSDEAYAGALAVVTAIRASAVHREMPSDLLEIAAAALPDTRVRDRLRELVVSQDSPEEAARGRGASGYVVDAVPLALLVAATSIRDGMESALHRAVSLGGDTDTIASIAGQVMGAAGIEPPQNLLKTVIGMQLVENAVSRFIEQIAGLTTPG